MAETARHRIGYADALKLTTSLCLCYTLIVAGLRTWIRRSIYGVDDVVITVATLISLGHFTANYAALNYGAGDPWKSISKNEMKSLNQVRLLRSHLHQLLTLVLQATIASVATFVLALYTSKAAVVTFLARISKQNKHALVYWSCLGFVVAAGIASIFIVLVGWPNKSGYYLAFSINSESCNVQVRAKIPTITHCSNPAADHTLGRLHRIRPVHRDIPSDPPLSPPLGCSDASKGEG